MNRTVDLTGLRFGKLLVICRSSGYKKTTWSCLCEREWIRMVYNNVPKDDDTSVDTEESA